MSGNIVYLHGFASGPGSKKAQFFRQRFAAEDVELKIPALDGGDFENLTITGQLAEVARAAGGSPVSLIGSSLGGWLAALYAARHSEVDRLVLMAPGFGFPRRWPPRLGEEKLAEWERTGTLSMFHYGANAEQRLSFELIRDGLAYEDYPAVAQPCLIFHGSRDDVVPVGWSEEFAAARPNVELHVVDSDHELIDMLEPMWARVRSFCL